MYLMSLLLLYTDGLYCPKYKYISNLYHTEYLYALACPKVERC